VTVIIQGAYFVSLKHPCSSASSVATANQLKLRPTGFSFRHMPPWQILLVQQLYQTYCSMEELASCSRHVSWPDCRSLAGPRVVICYNGVGTSGVEHSEGLYTLASAIKGDNVAQSCCTQSTDTPVLLVGLPRLTVNGRCRTGVTDAYVRLSRPHIPMHNLF
jgi:hypothetical protein